jgi:flagellar basal body-associated protein FliL
MARNNFSKDKEEPKNNRWGNLILILIVIVILVAAYYFLSSQSVLPSTTNNSIAKVLSDNNYTAADFSVVVSSISVPLDDATESAIVKASASFSAQDKALVNEMVEINGQKKLFLNDVNTYLSAQDPFLSICADLATQEDVYLDRLNALEARISSFGEKSKSIGVEINKSELASDSQDYADMFSDIDLVCTQMAVLYDDAMTQEGLQ